jgi:hypothetical protein
MSQHKDPNQGEGDRISARRYDRNARQFVAEGNVDEAAEEARRYVEGDPDDARKAEEAAKRGPASRRSSVDGLLAKGQSVGQSVIERVRPMVVRAVGSLRARFGRK